MKEATGGALLMGLAAGIILIFIIMVAFFISYGKAFRTKNYIVNQIEQAEGLSETQILGEFTAAGRNNYDPEFCYNIVETPAGVKGFTVEVTLFMQFDRTILGSSFLDRGIPISGETRIIEKGRFYDDLIKFNEAVFASRIGMERCS